MIVMLAFPTLVSAQRSEYIGYKYKPVLMDQLLPNGVKDMGGAIVSEYDASPVFGVGRFSKGTTQMLWLEKSTAEDAEGVKEWIVLDVLTFPSFGKNQSLMLGEGECQVNNKIVKGLIVFANFLPRKKTYSVIKAWKANLKTERFVTTSTKGVKCEYFEP